MVMHDVCSNCLGVFNCQYFDVGVSQVLHPDLEIAVVYAEESTPIRKSKSSSGSAYSEAGPGNPAEERLIYEVLSHQSVRTNREIAIKLSNWANNHIECLKSGKTVKFRPFGGSMSGRIESGQLVTVCPLSELAFGSSSLIPGDVVLCKVGGSVYLHLIKEIREDTKRAIYCIGNNKGKINGWIRDQDIYGKCVNVEP